MTSNRRQINRKYRYGITPVQFARLLDLQEHRCGVCRASLEDLPDREVHVDHDHACCAGYLCCGECVRGIVCGGCNIRLRTRDRGTGRKGTRPSRAWTPEYRAAIDAYVANPPARLLPRRRTVQVRGGEPEPIQVHPPRGYPGRPSALTEDQADELRELRAQGVSIPELMRQFGVSRASAYRYAKVSAVS